MKKISQIWFYFIAVFAMGLALTALYLLKYQPLAQFIVVVISAALYFLAGIIFHMVKGDLTKQIVGEFLAISIFAILAFAILTFWRVI